MNFIQNALIFVAWLGAIMVGTGMIGLLWGVAKAFEFDPRNVEERAGIAEFEGNETRQDAELIAAEAVKKIIKRRDGK